MTLFRNTKLMAVSAVALTVILASSQSFAVDGPNPGVESGEPVSVTITAEVDNNFDVDMTPADFGIIAVVPKVADAATITVAPNGTLTDDDGGGNSANARIISSNATATPITVAITGALATQAVYVNYGNFTSPTDGSSTLNITGILDNLAGTAGACTSADPFVEADPLTECTEGDDVTDGSGELTFNVGLSLSTTSTATPYASGDYDGEIEVTISY